MTTVSSTTSTTSSSSSSSTSSWADLSSNFETFVQLLTTQLQYQDPMEPMDTTEFTKQLVAYSQVEQQISTNDKLDTLIDLAQGEGLGSALSYLGWQVSSDSTDLSLYGGQASFSINVDEDVETVTVGIYDADGNVVRGISLDGEDFTAGEDQTIYWDGTDNDGEQLDDGAYSISVVAKDADGNTVSTSTKTYGLVTGIGYDDDGNAILYLGDVELDPSDVLDVSTYTRASTSSSSDETDSTDSTDETDTTDSTNSTDSTDTTTEEES